ncbi:MAG: riboflavin biosynthesis protein RibD, partial [Alphaproteobacteria bacterium]|nr:riboflavin biosynthesis protein RibD [Alphaproteobacteria bacterium]
LAAALLRARRIDRLVWIHAALLIGGDGIPAVDAFGIAALAGAPRFEPIASMALGEDVVITFRARE